MATADYNNQNNFISHLQGQQMQNNAYQPQTDPSRATAGPQAFVNNNMPQSDADPNSPKRPAQQNNQAQTNQTQTQPAQQQTAPSGPPAATGTPVSANGQIPPAGSIATYNPVTFNAQAPQQYMAPTNMPQSYHADTFSQFNGPDQSGTTAQQNALMSAVMANPETMNANVVAQMKEAQKQQALQMQQQTQSGYDQQFGAMGRLGSGAAMAARMGNDQNAMNNVLSGNRDMDIRAASTNRQDQLNALSASDAMMSGQMGRATQGYGASLAGQQAQAGANQQQASSALQNSIAQEQMRQAQFDSGFRNSNFDFTQQQANANQGFLGYQSQLEAQRFKEQQRQANAGFGLQGQSLGQQSQFHNDQMNFNYDQMDNNSQLAMLQLLANQGGG